MNFFYYSMIYLSLMIFILNLSRIIAKRCILKGYQLEEIKKIVWNVLNSFIINLTMIMILFILYEMNVLSIDRLLWLGAIILFIIFLTIFYLFTKLK
ncbi:hypothetical protein TEPIDINF_001055 [Tepidibacillus infernus]|uniref:Uncharacterized protein n=1 Tax=Tepidibacillus decaturensis TaxID=1413211 RepID=A0A135L3S6_9BACI|nr:MULTISPECIES: hypothetical protein [Tepidibacillus]KXG43652.1 hypothetical protein U473_06195 [Tepidibacillus decaturensis]GBF11684.1 hypothetical protein HK1_01722 [Tepidibacillus sp. HK-1]